MIPRENKNNAYAKFEGTKKEYYGIFRSGLLKKYGKIGVTVLVYHHRALKMGYFYWLRDKNSNHLHTELSLGYPKDTS